MSRSSSARLCPTCETPPRCDRSAVFLTSGLHPPYSNSTKLFAVSGHACHHSTGHDSVDPLHLLKNALSFRPTPQPPSRHHRKSPFSNYSLRPHFHAGFELPAYVGSFCANIAHLPSGVASCLFLVLCLAPASDGTTPTNVLQKMKKNHFNVEF